MADGPRLISDENLSLAWARAFFAVVNGGHAELGPLIVQIGCGGGQALELEPIRATLDRALIANGKHVSGTTANTIFPSSMSGPGVSIQQLEKRYRRIMPRLRRHRENVYGTYFQRLVAFGRQGEEPINQLEKIIEIYRRSSSRGTRPRRSALMAAIFDPRQDQTFQPRRGFPCLQCVTFLWGPGNGLRVAGFYATQDIFARAYGNYLGLWRLGQYVAGQVGRQLEEVQCVTNVAQLGDVGKSEVRRLAAQLEELVPEQCLPQGGDLGGVGRG